MDTVPKPGYKTTQFWTHIGISLLITLLTYLMTVDAGLPAIPKAVLLALGPLLLTFLQKIYNDGRTDVAVAHIAANSDNDAAAIIAKVK